MSSSAAQLAFIQDDFRTAGIDFEHCVYYDDCPFVSSCILINEKNGSRTIVHSNRVPDLKLNEFKALKLSKYKWIHFEGRNILEIKKMIEHVREYNAHVSKDGGRPIPVSVEMENLIPHVLELAPLGDLVIVGKDMARDQGYNDMTETAKEIAKLAKPGAVVVVPWGELGAALYARDTGELQLFPAYPPARVVDTLGAGDSFIAGLLYSLCQGQDARTAVDTANLIGGIKCGLPGYKGIGDEFRRQLLKRSTKTV